uniref:Uncharacterized protein n=1 Tax=Avena sativa TaxID=4498 RepID=A0ACD5Z706_AVESA
MLMSRPRPFTLTTGGTSRSVHRILERSWESLRGGTIIGTDPGTDVIASVRRILGMGDGENKMSAIEQIVMKVHKKPMTKMQRDAFKVAFAICSVTYLMSPIVKGNYFSTDYWGGLHTPELIPMYDWGKLVHDGILTTARRVKAETVGGAALKSNLSGCTLGLQVLYLDNLKLADISMPHDVLPRCKVYTQQLINKIISMDTVSGKRSDVMVYGRLVARPAESVCYSRNRISRGSSSTFPRWSGLVGHLDPMMGEISALMVDKVESFTVTCQETMNRAWKNGEDINIVHHEGWNLILSETTSMMREQSTAVFVDLQRITDVVKNRQAVRATGGDYIAAHENTFGTRGQQAQGATNLHPEDTIGRDHSRRGEVNVARTSEKASQLLPHEEMQGQPAHDLSGSLLPNATRGITDGSLPPRCGDIPSVYPDKTARDTTCEIEGYRVLLSTRGGGRSLPPNEMHIHSDVPLMSVNLTDDTESGASPSLIKRKRRKVCAHRDTTPKRRELVALDDDVEDPADPAVQALDGLYNAIIQEPVHPRLSGVFDVVPTLQAVGGRHSQVLEPHHADRYSVSLEERMATRSHMLNMEAPAFNITSDDEFDNQKEHNSLSLIPQGKAVAGGTDGIDNKYNVSLPTLKRKDLMAEFAKASDSTGLITSANKMIHTVIEIPDDRDNITGLDIVCTPSPAPNFGQTVDVISPVSRNREVAASVLSFREDLEASTLNLNVSEQGGGASTQPIPWRRVKPGPCARSPFVQGYEPPVRASSKVIKFYNVFNKETGTSMSGNWIISTQPSYIEFLGDHLRSMLSATGDLETEFINLVMRRYQQMDVGFANQNKQEGCWRLFLEADFANHVSRGDNLATTKYI